MPTIEIEGRTIEYAWLGPPPDAAPTIVLLHEGLGCLALWKDLPEELARATGCGVLNYSRYGYGASAPLAEPRRANYHESEARATLKRLIEHCAITRPPILFGHSDGASIALIYAADTDRPVAGLILEAPHVFVEEITIAGLEEAREQYETTDLRRKLARYHDDPDGAFWGWNATWLRPEFRSWNIEAHLPRILSPILLIQGESDPYGTLAQLEAIERQAAGPVETLVLRDCGHVPHHERREATLEAIVRFVSSLESGAVAAARHGRRGEATGE